MREIIKHNIYILIGIILLNVASGFMYIRIDFTNNNRYSLSKVSKNVIKNNQAPIVVDVYLTEDLPQDFKKLSKEFINLLKEYKSLSNVDFTINIIHPDSDLKNQQAQEAGIQPLLIEVSERDMEKIQNIFIGAVLKIGSQQFTIPFINQDTPMEYEVTRLLRQVSDTIKPRIGFIKGHHEALLGQMPQFINELSHLTDISVVDLFSSSDLDKYSVLCIIDPKDVYTPYEKEQMNKYLDNGGRLFVALNHAVGQINSSQNNGFINWTGVEDVLEEKGLKIQYDFVVDNNCGTIAVNQSHGFMNIQSNISFPYLPIITNFSKHTITYGLNTILLPFASSIQQVKTNTTYIFTPLATTSSISGKQQAPVFFNLQKQWTRNDFNSPHNIVAALLTNEDNNSAIVAITDADFLINDVGIYSHPLRTDNINFAVNSVEWLADNSGLIKLRNKFATFPALEPIDDHTKALLKYFNFLLPILITLIIALIRFRFKQIRRGNRSNPGYID